MYFLSIILLCFLFLETYGRPTHFLRDYDKDSKENSYRDSDSIDSDDYLRNHQKFAVKEFAGNDPDTKVELQEEHVSDTNEELEHARPDKDYLKNNDENQSDAAQISHNDALSMENDVKRTAAYSNGVMLFHNNEKLRKAPKNEYNTNNNVGSVRQSQYFKQRNVDRDAVYRDRREIKNNYLNEPIGTDEISTQQAQLNSNEDEETAIRRHVKKLSKDEFDELLHSLSEDKRELLKNIIDMPQQEYDGINKREITKKAGANGENSFVGNEQSDASKIQGGSANLDAESSSAPNFEKQESTKKADSESMYSKSTDIPNSSEKSSDKITILDSIKDTNDMKSVNIENLEASKTESKIVGEQNLEKDGSKKEKKREINSKPKPESLIEDPAILGSLNKDSLYCSENEELSQLWNDESNLYSDNKYKREVCSEMNDSINSLEESFPNAGSLNNIKPGADMVPLIRVKRNNPDKVVEKRDANVLSNLKVPYFSSALDDNEGNEEGGEFQDDGFFDRGANFAKSQEIPKQATDNSEDNEENIIKYCRNSQPTHNTKLETDTVSLGSDTDVVLSGIEGVDDNMMYNSVARIRRTGDTSDNIKIEGDNNKQNQGKMSLLESENEDNEISAEYNNAPRYQENDAFGSLPRNYEQDLGRYKRIRRLKSANNVPTAK